MENMKNLKKSEEKTCSKCNNIKKMLPQVFFSLLIISLAVYGAVDLVKQIVKLF
jgi:hypothetical protein